MLVHYVAKKFTHLFSLSVDFLRKFEKTVILLLHLEYTIPLLHILILYYALNKMSIVGKVGESAKLSRFIKNRKEDLKEW